MEEWLRRVEDAAIRVVITAHLLGFCAWAIWWFMNHLPW